MAYLLWQVLTRSAERYPERPAVKCGAETLTYAELETASRRVAGLLAEHGVGPGERVGLCLPKSHLGIVAMLGALRAGAAYVPVDPNAPPARAAYILRDCAVSALVTSRRKLAQLAPELKGLDSLACVLLSDAEAGALATLGRTPVRCLLEEGSGPPAGERSVETDPAYLLYTSGSTGHPKGVILSHRHALAFVEWGAETFGIGPDERLSNHAPFHFDLSVFDVYVALRSGACVVLVPDAVAPFPMELSRWIDAESITSWYSVPSALIRLLLHGELERFSYPALRRVLYAGEAFPVKHLRAVLDVLPGASFYNLYGPTETNVCTWTAVPRPLGPDAGEIPIGRACANTEVFAVRDDGARAQSGEVGELYVRGPSLMLGYWGNPEKTREVLVEHAFQGAYPERVYRTGDLVELQADGSYRFLGRRDHMVKSRGYRIELGEVEQVLQRHGRVREAVVLALPDDEIGARLLAAVALDGDTDPVRGEVQAFCRQHLPHYMVPETFVFRSELPKTSTGKTDRVALSKEFDPQ